MSIARLIHDHGLLWYLYIHSVFVDVRKGKKEDASVKRVRNGEVKWRKKRKNKDKVVCQRYQRATHGEPIDQVGPP